MFERLIESTVFYSRWLLAPMFVGLALGLVLLLVSFISEFVHFFSTDGMFHSKDTALFILELIDLTLIGSLVAMVAINLPRVFIDGGRPVALLDPINQYSQ